MKNIMYQLLLATVITLGLLSCTPKETADLIIHNGVIYTMNDAQPVAQALAVKGDKILFVGTDEEVNGYKGNNTQVIDLQGKTMTPGFIESHAHFMGIGYNELDLDLMYVESYEELVEKVKEAVDRAEPGQWIVGRGWHQSKWTPQPSPMVKGFQTHQQLSEVSPDNPVFLRHASGHAGFANAKAMEIAGVNQLSIESISEDLTEGGEIIRDELGNPTGIFNETAMRLIGRNIMRFSITNCTHLSAFGVSFHLTKTN